MEKYRIALYMRLSKEDDRKKEESNSISVQRMLLHHYVAEHFLDYELMEFADDGYTGTNFDRPGVKELLEDVKHSRIDCIVVKDFSRFARDYIELGTYLEQIFPFMGIRFISVNDGYDSKNHTGRLPDLDVNFKNLLYDLYSKDLSKKVRSSLAVKKEKEQYVSANSPFGYEKAPHDRHMLLIEEDEAEVVRKIFGLTEAGYTSSQIAKMLNEQGIKTPLEFKIKKGKTTRVPKGGQFFWSGSMVCQILRNRVYVGDIVQRKYTRECVGGKNRSNAKEQWLISHGHHEPIVGRQLFEEIQNRRKKKNTPVHKGSVHPLTGKLICGCCQRSLSYRKEAGNPYFYCSYRYVSGWKDCVIRVNAMFLEQYVLYQMQERIVREENIVPAELTKELIDRCIGRIVVWDEAHIEISWREMMGV